MENCHLFLNFDLVYQNIAGSLNTVINVYTLLNFLTYQTMMLPRYYESFIFVPQVMFVQPLLEYVGLCLIFCRIQFTNALLSIFASLFLRNIIL